MDPKALKTNIERKKKPGVTLILYCIPQHSSPENIFPSNILPEQEQATPGNSLTIRLLRYSIIPMSSISALYLRM